MLNNLIDWLNQLPQLDRDREKDIAITNLTRLNCNVAAETVADEVA